ncbi:MAG: L-seryl-tRNA(Sec) selenium transferase [Deltaproteobacteria bacterium HGW-Deltaproteobacteria-8]|nr:MAG: L-seryl-tRNA(Sec) selenium transferase [Deltaproteobacteria bacterium HGW-Deltaproteobacteria-8]
MTRLFRHLPAVDQCLNALAADQGRQTKALQGVPRPLIKDLVNAFLDLVREEIRAGAFADEAQLTLAALYPRLLAFARRGAKPRFRRVLNATGVVVHTNMGRSLLAPEAVAAVAEAAAHYSNLEFDLATGERGSRYSHVEALLCRLTGAEAALVVNNNAAAVLIVLDTLCKGREVIVSRGQLVEIGGSFRIPEVMAKSGAILREVGATNRTHLRDYELAISSDTAAIMKVHTSNFRQVGFVKEVPLFDLKTLAATFGLPVIEDLGSGSLMRFDAEGLPGEPTASEAIADGADVVSFSGDKVLGGPQAGIIVGRREIIERIKKNPLNRALRIDKMTLAALEATLRLYLDPDLAKGRVPTLAMMTRPLVSLRAQAARLAALLKKHLAGRLEVSVRPGVSRVGGGAFPEADLLTALVALAPLLKTGAGLDPSLSVDALRQALLASDPPLVARVENGALCLDPRTLDSSEHALVLDALRQALGDG